MNYALVCTSIAVGEGFIDGLHMDCNDEKMIDLPYPGGIAPGAKATTFIVDLGISILLNRRSMSFECLYDFDEIEDRLERLKDNTIIVAAAGNRETTFQLAILQDILV